MKRWCPIFALALTSILAVGLVLLGRTDGWCADSGPVEVRTMTIGAASLAQNGRIDSNLVLKGQGSYKVSASADWGAGGTAICENTSCKMELTLLSSGTAWLNVYPQKVPALNYGPPFEISQGWGKAWCESRAEDKVYEQYRGTHAAGLLNLAEGHITGTYGTGWASISGRLSQKHAGPLDPDGTQKYAIWNYDLSLESGEGSGKPRVNTMAASDVTDNAATLKGQVDPNGSQTNVSFEYGPDTSYGRTIEAQPSMLTGVGWQAVQARISDPAGISGYHFRAVAKNSAGRSTGEDVIIGLCLRVFNIDGDVEVKFPAGEDWEEAKPGMCIPMGGYISTGVDSSATLTFGTSLLLSIDAMTQVKIASFFDPNPTEIEIRIGRILADVERTVVTETAFKVVTPSATMAVRGTEFRVTVDEHGASELVVREGMVDLTPRRPDGKTTAVPAGGYGKVTESSVELRSATAQELAELDEDLGVLNGMRFDFAGAPEESWTDDGSGRWAVEKGVYAMNGNQGDALRSTHAPTEGCDYTYATDAKKVAGDGGGTVYSYGVLFRGNATTGDNYEFNILRDGRYRIGRNLAGRFTWLNAWTLHAGLRPGYDTWNRLKVVAQGRVLKFYANGTYLTTLEDGSLACGRPGLLAIDAKRSSTADTVHFDNTEFIPYIACQPMSAALELAFACVEYEDLRVGFKLRFLPRAAEPEGFYWVLDPATVTLPPRGNQCVQLEGDFDMTIPCARYDQTRIAFRLQFTPEAIAEGAIWKLDLPSLRIVVSE